MHSSTSSRRLSVLARLILGSAAAALALGISTDSPAQTQLLADDGDLPTVVVPKDPAAGSIEPGVIVPGHKVTWTWDDQE